MPPWLNDFEKIEEVVIVNKIAPTNMFAYFTSLSQLKEIKNIENIDINNVN